MVVQILGSIVGAGVVNLITKSAPSGVNGTDVLHFHNCIPQMADEYEWQGMLYEFLFTSMLIMQVMIINSIFYHYFYSFIIFFS